MCDEQDKKLSKQDALLASYAANYAALFQSYCELKAIVRNAT